MVAYPDPMIHVSGKHDCVRLHVISPTKIRDKIRDKITMLQP